MLIEKFMYLCNMYTRMYIVYVPLYYAGMFIFYEPFLEYLLFMYIAHLYTGMFMCTYVYWTVYVPISCFCTYVYLNVYVPMYTGMFMILCILRCLRIYE